MPESSLFLQCGSSSVLPLQDKHATTAHLQPYYSNYCSVTVFHLEMHSYYVIFSNSANAQS